MHRPWVTLVVVPRSAPIVANSSTLLTISGLLPLGDPVVTSLNPRAAGKAGIPFAGVGIDFRSRRRNKVAGVINSFELQSDSLHLINLSITTDESLGNCPKYITVRRLSQHEGPSEVLENRFHADGAELDPHSLALLSRASTIFLASRLASAPPTGSGRDRVGVNHRGGRPGFVRAYSEGGQTCLVLPDYSGNRFYQSLGNVQSDGAAALLVPDFATGDVLHVTGAAENLFGDDAARLMPRAALVTRIRVTAFVTIRGGLRVRAVGAEELSPYCPPLRLLASELRAAAAAGDDALNACDADAASEATATLVKVARLTGSVSAFTFRLGRPVRYLPGGHVILDFSRVPAAARPYAHMNDARPHSLNDDLVRAWTITSPPPYDAAAAAFAAAAEVTCAVRRVGGGAISPTPRPRF